MSPALNPKLTIELAHTTCGPLAGLVLIKLDLTKQVELTGEDQVWVIKNILAIKDTYPTLNKVLQDVTNNSNPNWIEQLIKVLKDNNFIVNGIFTCFFNERWIATLNWRIAVGTMKDFESFPMYRINEAVVREVGKELSVPNLGTANKQNQIPIYFSVKSSIFLNQVAGLERTNLGLYSPIRTLDVVYEKE